MQNRPQRWQHNARNFSLSYPRAIATLAWLYKPISDALSPIEVELWSFVFHQDYNQMRREDVVSQLGLFAGKATDSIVNTGVAAAEVAAVVGRQVGPLFRQIGNPNQIRLLVQDLANDAGIQAVLLAAAAGARVGR